MSSQRTGSEQGNRSRSSTNPPPSVPSVVGPQEVVSTALSILTALANDNDEEKLQLLLGPDHNEKIMKAHTDGKEYVESVKPRSSDDSSIAYQTLVSNTIDDLKKKHANITEKLIEKHLFENDLCGAVRGVGSGFYYQ